MEVLAQGLMEVLFGEATRGARRRRAAGFAASLGLGFQAEGGPAEPEAAARLEEVEALGSRFTRPVADTFWGPYQGRYVIGFENAVWDRRKRRHVTVRFTAVALARPLPDLLVAASGEKTLAEQWFQPDAECLPVPVPQGAKRHVTAADPASAGAVLAALTASLERSWMLRSNWLVGWHRGHLRTRSGDDAGPQLRFLLTAADAFERP